MKNKIILLAAFGALAVMGVANAGNCPLASKLIFNKSNGQYTAVQGNWSSSNGLSNKTAPTYFSTGVGNLPQQNFVMCVYREGIDIFTMSSPLYQHAKPAGKNWKLKGSAYVCNAGASQCIFTRVN